MSEKKKEMSLAEAIKSPPKPKQKVVHDKPILRKFEAGDMVMFGGLVCQVRMSGLNKNHFTLDEQNINRFGEKKTKENGMLVENAFSGLIMGLGEFDMKGRLLLDVGRYTEESMVQVFDGPETRSLLSKLLAKIGIYVR